jgi:hypothetical protein
LLPLRTLQRTPAAAALYRCYLYRPVRAHKTTLVNEITKPKVYFEIVILF